jgi:hypothetical protein
MAKTIRYVFGVQPQFFPTAPIPNVPPHVQGLIEAALTLSPQARIQTPAELVKRLENAATGATILAPAVPATPLLPSQRITNPLALKGFSHFIQGLDMVTVDWLPHCTPANRSALEMHIESLVKNLQATTHVHNQERDQIIRAITRTLIVQFGVNFQDIFSGNVSPPTKSVDLPSKRLKSIGAGLDGYVKGLDRLQPYLQQLRDRQEFDLEARLLDCQTRLEENLQSERFGSTETTRAARAQIMHDMNAILIHTFGITMTDMVFNR